jgi:magnesium-transporting ATPase (P-type)
VVKASTYIFTLSEVNKIVGFVVIAITLIVVAIPEGLPLVMILFFDFLGRYFVSRLFCWSNDERKTIGS